MNARFSGKVVMVAGGTGGLGRAVSLAFLEEDARVIVTCRHPEEFAALAAKAGTNNLPRGTRWTSLTNLPYVNSLTG